MLNWLTFTFTLMLFDCLIAYFYNNEMWECAFVGSDLCYMSVCMYKDNGCWMVYFYPILRKRWIMDKKQKRKTENVWVWVSRLATCDHFVMSYVCVVVESDAFSSRIDVFWFVGIYLKRGKA